MSDEQQRQEEKDSGSRGEAQNSVISSLLLLDVFYKYDFVACLPAGRSRLEPILI